MTRLNRIIKAFNDYDNFVKDNTLVGFLERNGKQNFTTPEEHIENIKKISNEVSVLIGELKRHGCRREN